MGKTLLMINFIMDGFGVGDLASNGMSFDEEIS